MTIAQLTIISRKSNLALTQAEIVKQQLIRLYPQLQVDIIGISTRGDEILDQPLNKIGGKGLFVSELEQYLLNDQAHIAVHSMKDLPVEIVPELAIGAVLSRADPRDVFVSANYSCLNDVPSGATIGTSSLRRQAQVLALRQDLTIKPLRGNVETRIDKLLNNQYAAIILAAAGLERLGLSQWLNNPLSTATMLPAVGQGALAIEYKTSNLEIKELLAPLNDAHTASCVSAERAMNTLLNGGCTAPIAGLAEIEGNILTLRGLVAEPNAARIIRATYSGPTVDAEQIGTKVAQQLIADGASEIIEQLKGTWINE